MLYLLNINRTFVTNLDNAFDVGYTRSSSELWEASFSLPNDDPKIHLIEHMGFIEIEDNDGEYIGLFRIMPSLTTAEWPKSETKYSCYHVAQTLVDNVYFGKIEEFDITPSTAMTKILSGQKIEHWVKGSSASAQPVSIVLENSPSLLDPMYDILAQLDENYAFEFNTRVYPWIISIVQIGPEPVCRLKEGYNMPGFEVNRDPSDMINRVYAVGGDEEVPNAEDPEAFDLVPITISSVNGDLPYVQDDLLVSKYGPIEYIFEDNDIIDREELKVAAIEVLDKNKSIKIEWKCKGADLIKLVHDPIFAIDRLRINTVVRVETDNFGDVDLIIRKESKGNLIEKPNELELELFYGDMLEPYDLTSVHKALKESTKKVKAYGRSILQQGRDIANDLINSGQGGHVRVHPDRILIMDTDDEATASLVWQFNKNGIGHSGTGISGPYRYAWTIDGGFNTDFIAAGSITVDHITSDLGNTIDLSQNSEITLRPTRTEIADEFISDINQHLSDKATISDLIDEQTRITELDQTLNTYFSFDADGLTIGKDELDMKLVLRNHILYFMQGTTQLGTLEGNQLTVNSLRLGGFVWMPRTSGNLSLKKI